MRTIGSTLAARIIGCVLGVLTPSVACAASLDPALLEEVNFARTNPQAYALRLEREPVSAWERGLAQSTDAGAFAEAVAFLKRQPSLPPLSGDENLTAAALDHVAEQGASGEVGHQSRGGEPFFQRLRRHGVDARVEGENIAYGPARAADVVRELIIDSGVADRGHRQNIFQPAFAVAGVTCGPHRVYGTVCVMDFSGPPHGASIMLARAEPPSEYEGPAS
jgi:uncharacterized protein YkwD